MLTVPNILTIFRLLAAPIVGLVFLFVIRPYADWIALALFVGASITDWFDGYLARKWEQTSKLGAMLDPIADKAMVVTALLALVALTGFSVWILVPAVVIMFRETFVSGLREYLGDTAGTLKVTQLAKWKTTVQMVAISVLFANGIFEHWVGMSSFGMTGQMFYEVINGTLPDEVGLRWKFNGMRITGNLGIGLLWLAMLLTFITGVDYFRKALPHLKG